MEDDISKIFESLRILKEKYKPEELINKIESTAKNLGESYSNYIPEYIVMTKQELKLELTEKEEKYAGILERNENYMGERINDVRKILEKIVGEIEK